MRKNTTDVTIYDVQTIENIRLIDSIVSQLIFISENPRKKLVQVHYDLYSDTSDFSLGNVKINY